MADFRERYKRIGFGREDLDINRVLRSQRRHEARHEQRSEHFSLRRDFSSQDEDEGSFLEPEPPAPRDKSPRREHSPKDSSKKAKSQADIEVAVQQKLLELERWQKERNLKKLQEKKKLKPAFKVGVVHHKVYSPPINKEPVPLPPSKLCRIAHAKQEPAPPKRVTRATEKRLAAKAVINHQRREDMRIKKQAPTKGKNKSSEAQFAPKNHQFRPPVGVTPLPLFGRLAFELDNKKNMNSTSVSSEVSSLSSNFSQGTSTLSDSVFLQSKSTDSFNTSKTKSRRSNASNFQPCDSSTNKNSQELTNNSSHESISLKLSSDDQGIQSDEHEEVEFSKVQLVPPKNKKSPGRKRRSTRKSVSKLPDTQSMSVDESKPVSQDHQDQEMMEVEETNDNQNESAAVNSTNITLHRKSLRGRRRSTKVIANETASPAKLRDANVVQPDQEVMLDGQKNVDSNINNASYTIDTSPSNKSISKSFNNVITEKSVVENGSISESLEVIDSKLKTTILDSPMPILNPPKSSTNKRLTRNQETEKLSGHSDKDLEISVMNNSEGSKLKRSKSVNTRKSTRFTRSKSDEETAVTSMDQESTLAKEDNPLDSTISKETRKSAVNKRRSTKIPNDENIPTDSPMIKKLDTDNHEVTVGRESVFDLQNKHLLDITLSDLNKLKTQRKKKSEKISSENLMDLQDQSLIKFSPRQSLRLQNEKFKQQASPIEEVSSTTKTPDNKATNQSLITFDPLVAKSSEKLNESASSEATKQKSPNSKNNSQNVSLNLTLGEPSSSEKPPVFYSPYIVTSRGKSNIRKEVQKRSRSTHRIDDDIPTKDTVMQSLNISVEDEERTAQYYKYLLGKEIERLNERCDTWNIVKEAESTPEDIHYLIQAAVGHTQLLINKKFQRFRGLVLDCETGKGEMLVTCKDLQGFWEMMYMEIKDVDNRFDKLEELKANNWVEETKEEVQVEQKQKKKPAAAKKPAVKKKPAAKSSSLRALIMAARKKMENKDSDMDVDLKEQPAASEKSEEKAEPVKTPNRMLTPNKSRWSSLANKGLTSSGRKSVPSSPLIVMKLSQMCKTPEVHLDDSIIYINSDRTPAKGILKGKAKEDISMSITRSTNKVFFKEQPMEVQEFATDKGNYRDSNEFEEADREPVERKLDFENDSFSHEEDEEKNEVELRHELYLNKDGVISERFVPVTPKVPNFKRSNSERTTRLTRSSKVEDSDATNVTPPKTPRLRRRNTQMETELKDSPFPSSENKTAFLTPRTPKSLKRKKSEAHSSDSSESTPKVIKPSPKVTRRTPKITKTLNSTNVSDDGEKIATPRLRRTKSLNVADDKSIEKEIGKKTPKSKLRRASSKTGSKEDLDKTLTPGVKRRSLKVT